jgi:ABC-type lipoprotein release transport system permease subunit
VTRLATLLLRLYPAAFRERYGVELIAAVALEREAIGSCGPVGTLRFSLHLTRDPATIATVTFVLGAVALIPAWAPASRASKIDPIEALRYE